MPTLEVPSSAQVFPTGANASQTQPYVPVERTISIPQLPDNITPDPQNFLAIQQNGVTNKITLGHLSAYIGGSPVDSVNGLIGDVLIGVFNLTDTTISNPQPGDFLTYQNGKWVNSSVSGTIVTSWNGMSGAVTANLGDLHDVTIVNPLNNQVLFYSFIKQKWENQSLGDIFPDIDDIDGLVTVTGPDGLQVDNALNVYGQTSFHNSLRPLMTAVTTVTTPGAMAIMNDIQTLTLDNLANVAITNKQDDDFILWDATTQKWQNFDKGNFFPDITDANGLITITGPAGLRVNNATNTYGSVTFHDNRPTVTNFVTTTNQSAMALIADLRALTINGLSDVSMTNPVPNSNIISWNELANKWVNIDYDPTKNVPSMLWTPSTLTTGTFSSVALTSDNLTGVIASSDGSGLYYTQNGKAIYQSNVTTGSYYETVQFKGSVYTIGTSGIKVTLDGETWTNTSITAADGVNLLTNNSVLIALFTGASTLGIYTTTNGSTWVKPITTGVYEVGAYKPDTDVAATTWLIGGVDVMSYSTDNGVTWTTEPVAFDVTAIEYAFGDNFLVSTTAGIYEAIVTDAPSIAFNLLTSGNFTDVIFDAGLILGLRENDVPVWSTDAINFYDTTGSQADHPLTTVAFGNGYWTAGGADTGIWWSIDGKEWALSNQTSGTLNKALYEGTVWLALMGDNGGVLWSNNTAGKVISVNGQTGIVQIGLNNLRGTRIITPQDGDFLIYNNGLWENRNIIDITNISVHNLTVTELATINDMVVTTATFSSLARFNGGLSSTTGVFSNTINGVGATFSGSLNVTGATTTGTLIAGASTFNSTIKVTALATLSGGLSSTAGTFSAGLIANTLLINNSATITQGLTVNGGINSTSGTFSGNISAVNANLTGDAIISHLGVTGLSTFTGLLTANGGMAVTGNTSTTTLGVNGAATVTGLLTSSGGLSVTGSASFNIISVTGLSTLSSIQANTAALGVATVTNGSLSIRGDQSAFPCYFTFMGNGGVGGSAYIYANYDSGATQTAFINFPWRLSDGTTPARPCIGDSNLAEDQIATLGDVALKANIDSPIFTGVPQVPTAAPGTNTLQAASTAYVISAISAGGNYPNLTSSGAGVNTLLSYAGTQGFTLTAGPFNANSETPSQFLYRPRVTTPSVNGTGTTYFALIGDITAGSLLDASFKTVRSAGVVNTSTLIASSTINVSGQSTLNGLTANSPVFTGGVVINQPTNGSGALIANNTSSNGFQLFPASGSNINIGTLRYSTTSVPDLDLMFDGLGGVINYKGSELAHVNSPALIGTPTAPTAPTGTNNTQIATTAFSANQFNSNFVFGQNTPSQVSWYIIKGDNSGSGVWIVYMWGHTPVLASAARFSFQCPIGSGTSWPFGSYSTNQTQNGSTSQRESQVITTGGVEAPLFINVYNNSSISQVIQWSFIGTIPAG